jgi:hypothetical protein
VLENRGFESRDGVWSGGLGVQAFISSLGSFVIFLAFGWPLFKDINQFLGITFADYSPKHLFQMIRKKNDTLMGFPLCRHSQGA